MKAKLNKLLALLTCFVMLFATINVTTVFADVTTDEWLTEEQITIPSEYDFSFMVIGDTQHVTRFDVNGLPKIYDYVVNNAQKKKVKHVMGLGDITDVDVDWEWDRVTKQIARMDGVVPYSIVRGNHDIYSTKENNKYSMDRVSNFDKIYGTEDSPYAKQYTYCYEYEGEGKETFRARNTVHFFSSSSRDYMVVALDYGPNDDILAWANGIIEAHPYHNVIITTHSYLQADGTTLDKGESVYPTRDFKDSNDGNDLWNELISKHENVVMVLCGHISCEDVLMVPRTGENGNVVSQFLINPQTMDLDSEGGCDGDSTKGMVATFYVDENGEDITVDWYSTIKGKYYRAKNNYSFKVNTIERHLYGNVSFDANGGSGEMQSESVYKPTYDIPECTFEKPAKNKIFKGWALTPTGEVITTQTIDITGDITLYAIWEEIILPTYSVTAVGGSVTPKTKFEEGELVTIKANIPEGKLFKEWYGADGLNFVQGSKWSAEATFEMPNKTVYITAVYESIPIPTYKITASAGANGSISKSGKVSVKQGEDYTFTFTPNEGYKIKDVLVNGTSVGAVESYTFTNVTANGEITVEFEALPPTQETPDLTPEPSVKNGCGNTADVGSTTVLVTISLAILMVLKRLK